jgi:hypothetical protein
MNFKNVNACSDDPVESWGFEGVLAVLQRGDLKDWHKLYVALRNDRQGRLRETAEVALDILAHGDIHPGLADTFRLLLT